MREPYVSWYGRGRKQNWTTPRSLFDPLHDEYGFTLDGAAERGNALLPKHSTADDPLRWDGERVFCNPPWSNIEPFVRLATLAEVAVLLVPARTNARWFHKALGYGAQVRFFLGRPTFENGPEDQKGHNSPVDCVLLVFGNPVVSLLSEANRAAEKSLASTSRSYTVGGPVCSRCGVALTGRHAA